MSVFSKQDYELINLGVCIKNQAYRLGIEHDGVPLEGVVVRIAERALSVLAEEPERTRDAQALAWLEGHAAGRDYQGDGWNSDAHDPDTNNPYRVPVKQEGTGQ